jgi:hypothetical protein
MQEDGLKGRHVLCIMWSKNQTYGGRRKDGNNLLVLHDTARRDLDRCLRLAAGGANGLDGLDDVHAFDDLAKYDVLAIQPARHDSGDEELKKRCVSNKIRRRNEAGMRRDRVEIVI